MRQQSIKNSAFQRNTALPYSQNMPKPPAKGQHVKPFRPAKDPTKTRISTPVRVAVVAMIHEGLTREQAAERAGIKDNSLYCALRKPDVLKFKTDVLREFREGLAERALVRVDHLADGAKSENVKLEANKTLLSLDDRFTPATKIKHEHSGNVTFTPGYAIDLTGDEPQNVIGNQVIDAEIVE